MCYLVNARLVGLDKVRDSLYKLSLLSEILNAVWPFVQLLTQLPELLRYLLQSIRSQNPTRKTCLCLSYICTVGV